MAASLMRRTRVADDGGMGTPADQPWMVLAGRPAPLAALFRSENERARRVQSAVDSEPVEQQQRAAPCAVDPDTAGGV